MASVLGRPDPVVLNDVPLEIDPAEVRAFQGYKPVLHLPPDELAAQLEAARVKVARLIVPGIAYRTVGVTQAGLDHLGLEGGVRLAIPGIRRHWGLVEAVTAAVVTIGPVAERTVRARREAGDEIEATLLDSAGSAAVECLAEWTNDHLCELGVAAGLRVTNRISPGLAGWALDGQASLLDLVPAAAIGVGWLTDGFLVPGKSIGLLVGIGRTARVDHYFGQCRRCWVEHCPWRRTLPVARVDRRGKH
jgi:hypothetical protein